LIVIDLRVSTGHKDIIIIIIIILILNAYFLDNRLTVGGDVVSLTCRPASLYPQEVSWYSFLLEAESTPLSQ
jgi:hypothetical protein